MHVSGQKNELRKGKEWQRKRNYFFIWTLFSVHNGNSPNFHVSIKRKFETHIHLAMKNGLFTTLGKDRRQTKWKEKEKESEKEK